MEDSKVLDSQTPERSTESEDLTSGRVERIASQVDALRGWVANSWKIGMLMAKGGYLLGERKRLFEKLGEDVYYRFLKGEMFNTELEPLVHEIEKLTKKVELEELLVRGIRFGKAEKRRYAREGQQEPTPVDEVD